MNSFAQLAAVIFAAVSLLCATLAVQESTERVAVIRSNHDLESVRILCDSRERIATIEAENRTTINQQRLDVQQAQEINEANEMRERVAREHGL